MSSCTVMALSKNTAFGTHAVITSLPHVAAFRQKGLQCLLTQVVADCITFVGRPAMSKSCCASALQIDNWNRFDVFQVGNLSKGTPLETVTLALFARHDLLDKLKIPYDRLQHFVRVGLYTEIHVWAVSEAEWIGLAGPYVATYIIVLHETADVQLASYICVVHGF